MYESISIGRQDALGGSPFDLGLLAECLVFYRKVWVITDSSSLPFLATNLGMDHLIELLETGNLASISSTTIPP